MCFLVRVCPEHVLTKANDYRCVRTADVRRTHHSLLRIVLYSTGSVPNAALYRPWVRQFFEGVPSHAGNQSIGLEEKYTPEAAALRAGLRSGKALVLNFTQPCPVKCKRGFVRFFNWLGYTTMIILPRQARDGHRES